MNLLGAEGKASRLPGGDIFSSLYDCVHRDRRNTANRGEEFAEKNRSKFLGTHGCEPGDVGVPAADQFSEADAEVNDADDEASGRPDFHVDGDWGQILAGVAGGVERYAHRDDIHGRESHDCADPGEPDPDAGKRNRSGVYLAARGRNDGPADVYHYAGAEQRAGDQFGGAHDDAGRFRECDAAAEREQLCIAVGGDGKQHESADGIRQQHLSTGEFDGERPDFGGVRGAGGDESCGAAAGAAQWRVVEHFSISDRESVPGDLDAGAFERAGGRKDLIDTHDYRLGIYGNVGDRN